jgi:hypothetical protein
MAMPLSLAAERLLPSLITNSLISLEAALCPYCCSLDTLGFGGLIVW